MFKLDRTAFKIQTFEQADDNKEYWLAKSPSERFNASWYLTCCAYNIDHKNSPRLDRNIFSARKNS
jgi:hypothetical protein